ncbi:MAG TPA: phosphoenolpyruvate synthase [Syntrophobacteraceae bacterium]|nr:phosphoenolpyruvate synthase [Syntrophobacteraceae bacterium]
MTGLMESLRKWRSRKAGPSRDEMASIFRAKYDHFKQLLGSNTELLNIITDMEDKLQGQRVFGMSYVRSQSARCVFHALRMIQSLNSLSANRYARLVPVLENLNGRIKDELEQRREAPLTDLVLPYAQIHRDMVDFVGGKSANLGEVLNRVHLPVAEGFAITTRAFDTFLAHNDLVDEINKFKMELDIDNPESIQTASEDIQRLIISAKIPTELDAAIGNAFTSMAQRLAEKGYTGHELRVSLRSSAIGEDSELSFAGQYLSLLNVPEHQLLQSYRYIVASLYTPRAISYRLNKGIRDEDVAMSVACLQMVESVASGVIYTRHPYHLHEDHIIISAVWGLGPYAVDGHITPDTYVVAKDPQNTLLETQISLKPVQLVSNPDGGLVEIEVDSEQRHVPCLQPDQIRTLARYATELENHYRCAQDIEWALDPTGQLLVLQTRPLRVQEVGPECVMELPPPVSGFTILAQGHAMAFPGVGSGPAFHVTHEEDLANFPDGAILVAKHSSPKYVLVMPKAQGIVTESGSVTGHMASLCREFQVPSVLDITGAMSAIPREMVITVDGFSGRVYQGRVEELLAQHIEREPFMKDSPVYQTLRRVADLIVPLHLLDPKAETFTPEYCQTLHDIMRFVHEKSYGEMFQISDLVSDVGAGSLKLKAPIPLDLFVIDLGGGTVELSEHARKVSPKQIVSAPFSAVLKGLLHKDLRMTQPRPVEFSGFFSVMREQMLANPHGAERFGDRSYAIISDKYLNFSSRVGYHYSVLDAYCGQTTNKNYITFSFKGGAADDVRRNRRARAIAVVLMACDFSVDVKGDRVDARFAKYPCEVVADKLETIGKLLVFTRQMDMLMNSETSIELVAKNFLEENYNYD